jgi:hypothetical protein
MEPEGALGDAQSLGDLPRRLLPEADLFSLLEKIRDAKPR